MARKWTPIYATKFDSSVVGHSCGFYEAQHHNNSKEVTAPKAALLSNRLENKYEQHQFIGPIQKKNCSRNANLKIKEVQTCTVCSFGIFPSNFIQFLGQQALQWARNQYNLCLSLFLSHTFLLLHSFIHDLLVKLICWRRRTEAFGCQGPASPSDSTASYR